MDIRKGVAVRRAVLPTTSGRKNRRDGVIEPQSHWSFGVWITTD
jgi:hypothetical protein